jgi:hypothetical protein
LAGVARRIAARRMLGDLHPLRPTRRYTAVYWSGARVEVDAEGTWPRSTCVESNGRQRKNFGVRTNQIATPSR